MTGPIEQAEAPRSESTSQESETIIAKLVEETIASNLISQSQDFLEELRRPLEEQ